jgi:uncharacterized SAM-binding protein YcdF (DUF218 family)
MARLVAVLGYSTRQGGELHPVCAARLRAAEEVAAGADAVVLSGWARRPHHPSEAELMTAAWHGPDVPLVPDGDARTTAGNARGVARLARESGATKVVAVTSAWHRRRAQALLRAALGPDVELELVAPAGRDGLGLRARELACLLALPLQSALLRRAR